MYVQDYNAISEAEKIFQFETWGSSTFQATLSASRPQSPFTTAWFGHILALGVNNSWAAYGPFMITGMTAEIQRSAANATFHVLPPCFFEGALSPKALPDQRAPDWDHFFVPKLEESHLRRNEENYLDPRNVKHSTFGYHWHNRWNQKIVDGSVAAAAEKMYCNLIVLVSIWCIDVAQRVSHGLPR